MNTTVKLKTLMIASIIVFTTLLSSCIKDNDCYDEELYQKHKDSVCPQDCPGVVGCDGLTYCNECEANKHGIRVE